MRTDILARFGNMIRDAREQQNLSQEELGFKLGFHRNYIGMIERAERNISFKKAMILIQYFDLDTRDLYDDQVVTPVVPTKSK